MKAAWVMAVLACLTSCGGGIGPHQPKVATSSSAVQAPQTWPTMVYVTDFDRECPQSSQGQDATSLRQGPLTRLRERLQGDDPVAKAHAAVGLMAVSITDDLIAGDVPATRLYPGAPKPATGWLVRGVVIELDEGNRIRRAMMGFGAGESDLRVAS